MLHYETKQVDFVDVYLKGVWHAIFDFMFFHESVSPGPMTTPLGPFRIFSKIREDILEWMFITGVNDTGDKLFTGVNDTGHKHSFAIISANFWKNSKRSQWDT